MQSRYIIFCWFRFRYFNVEAGCFWQRSINFSPMFNTTRSCRHIDYCRAVLGRLILRPQRPKLTGTPGKLRPFAWPLQLWSFSDSCRLSANNFYFCQQINLTWTPTTKRHPCFTLDLQDPSLIPETCRKKKRFSSYPSRENYPQSTGCIGEDGICFLCFLYWMSPMPW